MNNSIQLYLCVVLHFANEQQPFATLTDLNGVNSRHETHDTDRRSYLFTVHEKRYENTNKNSDVVIRHAMTFMALYSDNTETSFFYGTSASRYASASDE